MSRRFMCSEGLLLPYITICDFTCSFICRNEVVFVLYVLNPFKLWVQILSRRPYIDWYTIYCLYDAIYKLMIKF